MLRNWLHLAADLFSALALLALDTLLPPRERVIFDAMTPEDEEVMRRGEMLAEAWRRVSL